ncbi:MAG: alpha/beta hydrolase [Deltaproteobacteria bacterium]|nr:alpha/beta hydrolase [Deltaproteobacteria bacterium]
MPYAEINGVNLYYEVHGEGDPILLLHHGFGCAKIWKEIYPSLVERGFRVVMYDRRGFGLSEKGEDFLEFYVSDRFRPDTVRDLARLREVLGLDTFHIIGQCEGGVVAVDFAVAFPEAVRSIVISSTQCYSSVNMVELNHEKFPWSFQELDASLRDKLLDWHSEEYAESFYEQFRNFGGAYGKDFFDLRPELKEIACPFFVLYPDRSWIFDVEQAVAFYRTVSRAELAVLPKCGHNTYEHRPVEYVRNVLDFYERNAFLPPAG